MKKSLFVATMLLTSILLFTSCEKEEGDTTKPTINIINLDNGEVLYIGEPDNCLYVEFADDTELRSWAVEVHNNFNGHNHTKSDHHDYTDEEIANAFVLKKTAFDFDSGLRNTSVDIDDLLVFPDGVTPGPYHLGVYCLDASGNQSEVWYQIIVAEK